MTTSSHNETTKESRQRINVSFDSKKRGRRYMRHDNEGEMESIATASKKYEVKSSSSTKKQIR